MKFMHQTVLLLHTFSLVFTASSTSLPFLLFPSWVNLKLFMLTNFKCMIIFLQHFSHLSRIGWRTARQSAVLQICLMTDSRMPVSGIVQAVVGTPKRGGGITYVRKGQGFDDTVAAAILTFLTRSADTLLGNFDCWANLELNLINKSNSSYACEWQQVEEECPRPRMNQWILPLNCSLDNSLIKEIQKKRDEVRESISEGTLFGSLKSGSKGQERCLHTCKILLL